MPAMSVVRHPPYRIATRRLVVRCWNPGDAAALHEAVVESREHLLPWMPWAADEPHDLDRRIEILRMFRGRFDLGEEYTYGVFDPKEQRVLGGTGLHTRAGAGAFEIGYWTRAGETQRGIATEVAAALTRVAFELLRVDRVEIRAEPTNRASLAIPRKLGFAREARLRRRHIAADGERRDLVVWTLFASTYRKSAVMKTPVRAWDAAGREIRWPKRVKRATRA